MKSFLDRKQVRLLEDWVKANFDDLKSKRLQLREGVIRATQDLGFEVSISNLRSAAKTMDAIFWVPYNHAVGKLELEMIRILVDSVVKLYDQLGVPLPGDLNDLAIKFNSKEENI